MDKDELEVIKQVVDLSVKEAVQSELGAYKVPKEQHYKDHEWLLDLREFTSNVKSTAVRTIVGLFISGLFGIIILGFIFWGKKKIGSP